MATGRNYFRQFKIQADITDRQASQVCQKFQDHPTEHDQQGCAADPTQDDQSHRPILTTMCPGTERQTHCSGIKINKVLPVKGQGLVFFWRTRHDSNVLQPDQSSEFSSYYFRHLSRFSPGNTAICLLDLKNKHLRIPQGN